MQSIKTYKIVSENGQRGITCLKCGRTSWSIADVTHKYCGNCHIWHDDERFKRLLKALETQVKLLKRIAKK